MKPGLEEHGSDVVMGGGRDADGGSVERDGCEALLDGGEDGDGGLGGQGEGALGLGLDDGSQRDWVTSGLEVAVDADVILSEGACAANSDPNWSG
jgi:hypothetical protein